MFFPNGPLHSSIDRQIIITGSSFWVRNTYTCAYVLGSVYMSNERRIGDKEEEDSLLCC